MKMIVDGKILEFDENDKCDYWDIEDRLYEQYKEMKIGDQNRNQGIDFKFRKSFVGNPLGWIPFLLGFKAFKLR